MAYNLYFGTTAIDAGGANGEHINCRGKITLIKIYFHG
jgi:hypothetical protein